MITLIKSKLKTATGSIKSSAKEVLVKKTSQIYYMTSILDAID